MSTNDGLTGLLEVLGLDEEPLGLFYTDQQPREGISPKAGQVISKEKEEKGELDFGAIFGSFGCVIGVVWRARSKQTTAWFDCEHYGCVGGSFFLGFHKPQLDLIVHYVSSGIPGRMEGELYGESPEVMREFFNRIDPRPAPARYCVVKPVSQFTTGETPETVTFFARPESMSGLHQLVTFVTNDVEAVVSPWGAGCTNMVTWPLKYLEQGVMKAVLGGWDPSARKYYKTDEITMTVPYELYLRLIRRWPESFLTHKTWQVVEKKISRSRRAWGEE